IQEGEMDIFIDGFSQTIGKSAIITINPEKIHSCKTQGNNGYKYKSIYFKSSFLKNIFKDDLLSKNIYFNNITLNNKSLFQRLSFLIFQNENNLITKFDFECEFIDILSKIINLNSIINTNIKFTAHDLLVKKAKEYMNKNFYLELSLDDIVDDLNISKYHFIKVFKEKTHISPYNYLMLIRMEKAKQALQNGESLIATAYNCGFNDQSHLNRKFQSMMGLTPGIYKKFFN
ncbi:MAG: helix-turn-helix domain-containing protein, partial [Poseidonibacter sp.]|uniref:helix-turn-helix domain-containing protein n=1 Tax=Poseidonibacter sp. TaxID=2321188 RepID=UPI00359D1245